MNQQRVIECLYRWLREHPWSDSLSVKCDHVTETREELALFLGPKTAGTGRGNRVAQVDILVCDEKTRRIELIVEVDPNPSPKKLMGDVLAVLLADNYTPSYSDVFYRFECTLFVFLTCLEGKERSQKRRQFHVIEEGILKKLPLASIGVRDVRLCFGVTDDEAVARCQNLIQAYFSGRDTLPDLPVGTKEPEVVVAGPGPAG